MTKWKLWCSLLSISWLAGSALSCAQQRVVAHACDKKGSGYSCNRTSFLRVLQAAKTVSIGTPRLDASSSLQLEKLARTLGKTVRSDHADLTFVLVRPEPDGIYYGPSDRALAAIRVYYGADASDPGKLIWVETSYGQPDTPWPIVVNHMTEQFRHDAMR